MRKDIFSAIQIPLFIFLLGSLFFTQSFAMYSPDTYIPNNTRLIGIPNMVKDFTPREKITLNTLFQDSNYVVLTQQDNSIPCGVGKTYLAKQYANEFSSKYSYVLWFDATSEKSLEASLSHILKSIEQSKETFSKWVESTPGILLVFDNAKDNKFFASYFPGLRTKGHILITSRNRDWPDGNVIPVSLFTKDESAKVLAKIRSKPLDQATKDLAASLEGIPSLISEVGYMLKNSASNAQSYKQLKDSDDVVKKRLVANRGKFLSPISNFSGMKLYLAAIKEALSGDSFSIVFLYGPSSKGKTAIAHEFALQNADKFKRLWNIPCSNEESLKAALSDMATSLEIKNEEPDIAKLLSAIYEKLSKQDGQTLLIFDAIDPTQAHLLPSFGDKLRVIVTSQSGDWKDKGRTLHIN